MKKMLFLLSAFVLIGSYGFAQSTGDGDQDSKGTESSTHGSAMSNLAQSTTVTGKEKGSLIGSAARAQALTVANANARFLRGDAKPSNANANTNANANANANTNANAGLNASANVNASASANGKPATLPPVSPPTTGQPTSTPVGKPVGVPVAVQGTTHAVLGNH